MEVIKEEPAWERVKLETEEGLILKQSLEEIKVEQELCEVVKLKTESENIPAAFTFIAVNQREEELHDAVLVKDELNLEEATLASEVPVESVTPLHNNEISSRESWNYCGDTSQTDGAINHHVEDTSAPGNSSMENRIAIEACGEISAENITNENLGRHLKIAPKNVVEVTFKCAICGKCLANNDNLKRHMRSHTGVKPFKCDVCGKVYAEKGTLMYHLRSHTGDKPFKCHVCSKVFARGFQLKDHLRMHTGDKPFKCDFCGKFFARTRQLKIHTRIHTGHKPFKCDVCCKNFARSGDLKKHVRTHTGEKPFICRVCGRGFSESKTLTDHLRIHTGDKPFKCDQCDKHFIRSSHLNDHMRRHTDEKPFNCDVCGKVFGSSSGLRYHLRQHTEVLGGVVG